jgi:hypothetical protein
MVWAKVAEMGSRLANRIVAVKTLSFWMMG